MQQKRIGFLIFLLVILPVSFVTAEDGYDLWLRYVPIKDPAVVSLYNDATAKIILEDTSSEMMRAAADELVRGVEGLLVRKPPLSDEISGDGAVVIGTPENSEIIASLDIDLDDNKDAYVLTGTSYMGHSITAIASKGETGVLYGVFHFLRLMQTGQSVSVLDVKESPKIRRRLLNHWDNLSGSIERGYAGNTLWNWSSLPGNIGRRYTDYARACASIGINGTVLNNVNADANILTSGYLQKVAALANAFRPYGVHVYVSANFAAPQRIGNKGTADPLNGSVQKWWADKCNEIYKLIPDFGGFLVKANSEGQPGPKTYGRTHAEGANCLADAIAPHGGVVIWRAFVYDNNVDADRMKRAYKEFKPLDGKFRSNVIVQAKNGPFDFQPREPVHPLFGGLQQTHLGGELQITKEYLGQNVHLVYLAPMWKEVFDFDTYAAGKGSTVGKVLDGTVYGDTVSCIAGVANTGSDKNWCGHPFDQANWYAFGRLAWDYTLSADTIADEWVKMTWSWQRTAVTVIKNMLAGSHEACVNYMDPLGLGGIFKSGHHYGPAPEYNGDRSHPDWNSVYWHRADGKGVGYDRTTGGSNLVSQYFPENKDLFNDIETCPPELLCWFHHVPWNHEMATGRSFWDELCNRYNDGLHYVKVMGSHQWPLVQPHIDSERYKAVVAKLDTHYKHAKDWRDVCLRYFGGFSKMPVPEYVPPEFEPPTSVLPHTLPSVAAVKKQSQVHIFDLSGRLVTTITLKSTNLHQHAIRTAVTKNVGQGLYLIRGEGIMPQRLMVGLSR